MEKLTIKTPSDVLSFSGHTLGFWPQESLVCITMNENSIGATLRIDLPRQPGQELNYARTVAHYLTSDTTATFILFVVYTSETARSGQPRPHAGAIAALTGVLAEQGITIRDGLFVGEHTFSPYDGETGTSLALPVSSTQTSAINAEFIYRGSFVEPTNRITLPTTDQEAAKAAAVEHHMETIASQPSHTALQQGRKLWANMLDSKSFPSDNRGRSEWPRPLLRFCRQEVWRQVSRCQSVFSTHLKLAALFVSPTPEYCGYVGYSHSGRVKRAAPVA